MKTYISVLFLVFTTSLFAQIINQYDNNGKRHGVWKKYFDKTKELRYEGQFNHGKEVGLFKFYTLNKGKSVLSATKEFNDANNTSVVKFMSSKGKLISEGQMDGKLYIGQWTFYHNKSNGVMSTELYNDKGELHGEKLVYYPNGKVAERSNYADGKLNGKSTWYTEKGNVLKVFEYKNDELNGLSKYYDNDGNIKAEGVYKDGLKHGVWKYYEAGKLVKSKDHTKRSKNPNRQ
ncbi:toxin-antitoxin system YwqK family antitoxin [uncultured Psychroserpens sp.]|uniref:toxin-antitoxin system YwqK family antitoxin n=1 Tax=uncultured Psychroserpens sp. TaxID=255436 RepID=UPI0026192D45|nr:toxin-antitoxin system YwqK family antitoxin [uncultured Psychroserpens sp.]